MDGNPITGQDPEYVAGLTHGLRRLNDRIAMETEVFDPSLESIVAVETAISSFESRPLLRGFGLADLASGGSFLEVVHLLLIGELPDGERLADLQSVLSDSAALPKPLEGLIGGLRGRGQPIDVMRSAVSMMGHFDPQPDEHDGQAVTNQTLRLLARLPATLAREQSPFAINETEADYVPALLESWTGREPTSAAERALDVALLVMAEQGLDAAAFAARAAISTGGDLFAAMTAALAVFSGPLHGGPCAEILDMLTRASREGIEPFVEKRIAQGHSFRGFDPRLDPPGDPRVALLAPICRELAVETGHGLLEETAGILERRVGDRTHAGATLDLPMSRLLFYLGFDAELFKPLAAIARISGWAAHAIEQSERNQMLRPRSRYIGPSRRPVPPPERRG